MGPQTRVVPDTPPAGASLLGDRCDYLRRVRLHASDVDHLATRVALCLDRHRMNGHRPLLPASREETVWATAAVVTAAQLRPSDIGRDVVVVTVGYQSDCAGGAESRAAGRLLTVSTVSTADSAAAAPITLAIRGAYCDGVRVARARNRRDLTVPSGTSADAQAAVRL